MAASCWRNTRRASWTKPNRSLAQMRAETERSLANQAVALRDAERAAELAAIERRNTDMEAAREARNREAQDIMAGDAASARKVADHQAEASAQEKKSATDLALTARQARLQAEREMHVAHTGSRRARFSATWATLRAASPIKVGIVALMLGCVGGLVIAELNGATLRWSNGVDVEPRQKLDTELSAFSLKR